MSIAIHCKPISNQGALLRADMSSVGSLEVMSTAADTMIVPTDRGDDHLVNTCVDCVGDWQIPMICLEPWMGLSSPTVGGEAPFCTRQTCDGDRGDAINSVASVKFVALDTLERSLVV